jgi:hypothetical protein
MQVRFLPSFVILCKQAKDISRRKSGYNSNRALIQTKAKREWVSDVLPYLILLFAGWLYTFSFLLFYYFLLLRLSQQRVRYARASY